MKKDINRTIKDIYFMHVVLDWPIYELIVSKATGGVFAKKVISQGMMIKGEGYTYIQKYLYPPGWMAEDTRFENGIK